VKARYKHTNIVARDWRRLADFYIQIFGCEPVPPERHHAGEWLARGTGVPEAALEGIHLRLPGYGDQGPTLEIFSYRRMEAKPPTRANRLGITHLAFEVEDVNGAVEEVLARGGRRVGEVVTRYVPEVGELTFVYVTDPEGNIIELQNWK